MGVGQIFHFEKDFLTHTHRHYSDIMASKQTAPGSDFFAFEDVAAIPRPATTSPASVSFAPDGKALFYLGSGAGGSKSTNRNLFSHALAGSFEASQLVRPPALDTEANLSAEEKLRRERMRQMSTGVRRTSIAESKPRRRPTSVRPHSDAG